MSDKPPTILLVDDDPVMHRLFERHFQRAGYRMISALNATEAHEIALRELPQLILMDVMMPGTDGLQALRDLKRDPTIGSVPVIVVTANTGAHNASRQESLNSGAAGFITKPLSPAQLLEEVKKLIPLSGTSTPPSAG